MDKYIKCYNKTEGISLKKENIKLKEKEHFFQFLVSNLLFANTKE